MWPSSSAHRLKNPALPTTRNSWPNQKLQHLKSIGAKYDSVIREVIAEQLLFEPGVPTKNRKPLRPPAPFGAQWEIRFGPDNRFRVLYDIDEQQRAVQILAIGVKERDRLIVGREEVEL